MDWGRVKTILILTFLFLNILLGYQLWMNKFSIFGTFGSNEEAEQLKEFLQNKDITMKQEVPLDTPKVREIDVVYDLKAAEQGRQSLVNSIQYTEISDEEELEEQLQQQISFISEYRIDPVLSRERVIVLNQQVERLPMFDIHLKLYVNQEAIEQYEQSYVRVVRSTSSSKEQTALAASRAIRLLAEKFLQPGDVIVDVRLGYHGQMFNSDTQVLAPKWRVVLDNGTMYYVHAISGEVEKQ